jgi:protein TonB
VTESVQALYSPWLRATEDDQRFWRILRITCLIFLLPGLAIPYLPLPAPEHRATVTLPPRLARLMLESKPVPPSPAPVKPPVTEAKPLLEKAVSPAPRKTQAKTPQHGTGRRASPEKKISAREQAEQAGLLALRDTLQDLRQSSTSASLKQAHALTQGRGQASRTERAILTYGTTRGSDGINTAKLSRDTGGIALAGRSTQKVARPPGTSTAGGESGGGGYGRGGDSASGGDGRLAGRSIEEIQMVFDRNKGAIYSVYNRVLRSDPSLQGKVVLRLTIAPSGQVTRCELLSSELHDAALGEKIAQRVKLFDFGAKNVGTVTITYPIDFLPA